MRSMFSELAWVGTQDESIAARFRGLGTNPTHIDVTGSMKWDTAFVTDRIDGQEALARAVGLDAFRPVWVCGSTGPGEEERILEAYRELSSANAMGRSALDHGDPSFAVPPVSASLPRLVIVPRKPERFDEVARLVERAGFACMRRSQSPDGCAGLPDAGQPQVVLGDTMGELRKFYALADVVFVGRSLVPMGGSDVMEAAALGKPIFVGPHHDNFAASVAALGSAGAVS